MSQACGTPKTFTATEVLAAFRRVKLTASSGSAVEYSDAGENFIGATLQPALTIGDLLAVKLRGDYATFKLTAAGVIAVGATIYAAADGKVSASVSGTAIGTALAAAGADGDVIEVFLDNGAAGAIGATATIDYQAANGGIPFLVKASLTAAGAEDESILAALPRKAEITRAWMFARDTQAANVTLKQGGNAFTAATAKGGTDAALVSFNLIAAYKTVAAAAALVATFSAAGAVDVFIEFVPVA